MWFRAKYILLPLSGALAAILSFSLAQPYASSLSHMGLSPTDPAAHFTYGTMWGEVQRLAFGALLCGAFCFLLSAGRQAWWKVARSTLLGAGLGAVVNYMTDSGSDRIGIALSRTNAMLGEFAASTAWSVLVPAGIAFTVALSVGPTRERFRRAIVGTIVASVTCYWALFAVQALSAPDLAHQGLDSLINSNGVVNLQAMLPVFRSQAIAVGVALGFTMMVADQWARAGTLRLLLGRNEYRDWSLDYAVSRIGSSEGLEIPVWGFQQVAPVHARIVRSRMNFVLEGLGPPLAVNGIPVASAILVHGDTITVGDSTLVFLGRGLPRPMQAFRSELRTPVQGVTHQLVDASGGHYTLGPGLYEVGRDAGSAICLSQETTVSRRHASITVSDQGAQLVDLGSSNGTRVNGVRITTPTPLRSGDAVEFGSVRFLYR